MNRSFANSLIEYTFTNSSFGKVSSHGENSTLKPTQIPDKRTYNMRKSWISITCWLMRNFGRNCDFDCSDGFGLRRAYTEAVKYW